MSTAFKRLDPDAAAFLYSKRSIIQLLLLSPSRYVVTHCPFIKIGFPHLSWELNPIWYTESPNYLIIGNICGIYSYKYILTTGVPNAKCGLKYPLNNIGNNFIYLRTIYGNSYTYCCNIWAMVPNLHIYPFEKIAWIAKNEFQLYLKYLQPNIL